MTVYPRVCGGTLHHRPVPLDNEGLSPRVRGNPSSLRRRSPIQRSIPACAGEPSWGTSMSATMRVYPRVCGGTNDEQEPCQDFVGLSPRVRGNRILAGIIPSESGSIPACAGEPTAVLQRGNAPGVYPRVCGGTSPSPLYMRRRRGLSPRVRGNPSEWPASVHASGSIPACAGEPAPTGGQNALPRVYPRVCGGTGD